MQTETCLVLMFKSPEHSKRRLSAEIGAAGADVARLLFDCAAADLEAWPGPTCMAPAEHCDLDFVRSRSCYADIYVDQGAGNLGERIENVNQKLLTAGHTRQLFIGIDCPELDDDYLAHADSVLRSADVVLGPAHDGGVVTMGITRRWPSLGALPWSTQSLAEALTRACEADGLSVASLAPLADVDTLADLRALRQRLRLDARPSRRQLYGWLESAAIA